MIDPDAPTLRHVSVVGDTYTILLSGADTAGRYCLIDMTVPHCGGPGPHRHDFEEMFTLLDGQDDFFLAVGKVVASRTTVVAKPSNQEMAAFIKKAEELAPRYHTELLKP